MHFCSRSTWAGVQNNACRNILSKIPVLLLKDITVLEAICDFLLVSVGSQSRHSTVPQIEMYSTTS